MILFIDGRVIVSMYFSSANLFDSGRTQKATGAADQLLK
jgi:hypothetical protein